MLRCVVTIRLPSRNRSPHEVVASVKPNGFAFETQWVWRGSGLGLGWGLPLFYLRIGDFLGGAWE